MAADQQRTEAEQAGDLQKVQQMLGTKVKPKPKSVLDGIPVVENTIHRPVSNAYEHFDLISSSGERLEPVGACPHCGSPIYGKKHLAAGEVPILQRSCSCVYQQGNIHATMQTK